jgi:hypothetical protein
MLCAWERLTPEERQAVRALRLSPNRQGVSLDALAARDNYLAWVERLEELEREEQERAQAVERMAQSIRANIAAGKNGRQS